MQHVMVTKPTAATTKKTKTYECNISSNNNNNSKSNKQTKKKKKNGGYHLRKRIKAHVNSCTCQFSSSNTIAILQYNINQQQQQHKTLLKLFGMTVCLLLHVKLRQLSVKIKVMRWKTKCKNLQKNKINNINPTIEN